MSTETPNPEPIDPDNAVQDPTAPLTAPLTEPLTEPLAAPLTAPAVPPVPPLPVAEPGVAPESQPASPERPAATAALTSETEPVAPARVAEAASPAEPAQPAPGHLAEPVAEPVAPAAPLTAPSSSRFAAPVDPAPPVAPDAGSPTEAIERALAVTAAAESAPVVGEPVVVNEPVVEVVAATVIAEAPTVAAPLAYSAFPEPDGIAAPIQPIVFLEPLEEPKPVGNRGAGVLIALLSTVVFAAALWALSFVIGFFLGDRFPGGIADSVQLLQEAGFWGAVIGFFLGSVIVALVLGRSSWWAHLLLGLLIAAFAYAGAIGGDLFQNRDTIYTDEVGSALLERLIAPLSLVAFILAREVSMWFSAWTAALGRRARLRTAQEREEYENELSARG